jgi:hypothetical protein
MKYHDLKVIEGSCRGFGSWMGNPLNTPSPGDIFYYKNHQRGGSSKYRGKSRKYYKKYTSARKRRTRRTRRTRR